MARVLLVQPPWYILQNIKNETFSIGLAYLAAVLKEAGHQVLLFNGEPPESNLSGKEKVVVNIDFYKQAHELANPVWDRFRRAIEYFRPDVVGISVWTGGYRSALNIARISREFNPDITVIAGGVHASLVPLELLEKNQDIDYVVSGEGEVTTVELISALENKTDINGIPGVYSRKDGKIIHTSSRPHIDDLGNLPFPDFEDVFEKNFYSPDAFGAVIASRGCPYLCSYCASSKLWTNKVRFRSPGNIVDEIEHRIRTCRTQSFRFNDDTFTLQKEMVLAVCDLILNRKLRIRWQCDVRADTISPDLIKCMKEAGCYQVNMGVESASSRILSQIKKNISLREVRNAVRIIRSQGIDIAMYFMIGFPGETKQEALETIHIANKLKPDIPIWSIVTPYPGTEIYESLKKQNLLPRIDDWSLYFHHSPLLRLTDAIADADWHALIEQVKESSDRLRVYYERKIKKGILRKRLWPGNVLRAVLRRVLLLHERMFKKISSFSFVVLNASRKKDNAVKIYYGYPEDISIRTAAFLKVKKLRRYFPEYKKGFNLIYTINGYYPDYAVCKSAKRLGIPIVYNANGVYYKAWYGPGWEKENEALRRAYMISDYVVFQSRFSKLSAETFLGKPPDKWEILYNPVDTAKFVPEDFADEQRLTLLAMGNHLSFHRLEVPVRALKILMKKGINARLIIAGYLKKGYGYFNVDGNIQKLVSSLGLGETVEFLSPYDEDEVVKIYQSAHILVHMQYNDVCPSAVIEAMACGLPVVYSSSGGTPELVGVSAGIGLPVQLDWDYYRVPDPEEVTSSIIKVAQNRKAMSSAARNRAVQNFDIRHWAERHRQIFNTLIK